MAASYFMKERIEQYLRVRNDQIGYVFPNITTASLRTLDLSSNNHRLTPEIVSDTAQFDRLVQQMLAPNKVGIGGYLESRSLYQRSPLFSEEEIRSLHIGVDVWTPAGTKAHASWPGRIQSFNDNRGFGNYGPTIILEHAAEGAIFFTLYGHLSRQSLQNIRVGQLVDKSEEVGEVGNYPENGSWPPHLHFQVMTDLLGYEGDFPGVIAPSQKHLYESICIDPQLLLTFK